MKFKKIVVTGGAGFIGSNTIKNLLKENVGEIIIYDNFSRGKLANIKNYLKDKRVKIVKNADILNQKKLNQTFKKADIVYHFAALWLLHCHKYPRQAFDANILGTLKVLEACRLNKVKKIIYASSASVYGDPLQVPITETHPLNNKNLYGATKISSESLLTSYYYRYGLNFVGLRYMNVYGNGQDNKGAYIAVIMRWITNIKKNKDIYITGTGNEIFDFINIEDVALANIAALNTKYNNEFYNVGTGIGTSLKKLAKLMLNIKKSKSKIKYIKNLNNTLVKKRIGSTKKAKLKLKFTHKVSLREGLTKMLF